MTSWLRRSVRVNQATERASRHAIETDAQHRRYLTVTKENRNETLFSRMVRFLCVRCDSPITRRPRAGFLSTRAITFDALRCSACACYRMRHDAGDRLPADRYFHRLAIRALQCLCRAHGEQWLADARSGRSGRSVWR